MTKNNRKQKYWQKKIVIYTGILLLSVASIAAIRYSPYFPILKNYTIDSFNKGAVKIGFGITNISIKGRIHTPKEDLLNAIHVKKNQSIFSINITKVKENIEKLGWIRSANVQRRFPDTLFIVIKERTPIAIWQLAGKLYLINKEGIVISSKKIEKFSHLKILVGNHANTRVVEFLRLIARAPILAKLTSAGVLVSNRRWNIVLSGKITVKLPADNPEHAWEKLAQYVKEKRLLTKPLKYIDMRIPGKILLRLSNNNNKRRI